MRPSTSKSRESIEDENARERSQMEPEGIQISTQIRGGATEARKESQTLEVQTRKCQILQQLIIQNDRTVEKKKSEIRGKETGYVKEKRKPNRS